MKNTRKGFTLVELVIVIAVIAILAGVMIGTFANVVANASVSKSLQKWRTTIDEAYLNFVAEYNTEPTCVNKDLTVFSFVQTPNATDENVYELKVGECIVLETVDNTAICLVKLNGGLKVVTGTVSGNTLTYDNTTATKASTYVKP